jgi:hypothetical protein
MRLPSKGKRKSKFLYLAVIILVVLSIVQPLFEFKGSIFVHEDTPFIGLTYPLNDYTHSIYDSFFLYDVLDYSGNIQQGMNSPLNYLFTFLFLPLGVTNGIISNTLFAIVFMLIGSLSMFVFIYKLFEKNKPLVRIMASFVGALIFFPVIGAGSAFLPLCFLFVFLMSKNVSNNIFSFKRNCYDISGSILSFSFLFAFGGFTYLIQNFILLFLLVIFVSLLISKSRLKLFFILLSILVVALLTNLSDITGAYLLSLSYSANIGYYSIINAPLIYAFGNSNVLYALQILPYTPQPLLFLGKLLLFVIGIIGLVYFIKRRVVDNEILALVLSSFIIFIIITFFYNTIFMPFGSIFNVLISHFKFLYVIRYGNGSFSYILEFVLGILSATAIVASDTYFKYKSNILIFVFLMLALIGFAIFYYSSINPYIGNNFYYVKIPNHVYALSSYISNNTGNFGVAVLPSAAGFQYLENWYTGTDIYSYFINKPVYTGGYIAQTEIFYPVTKYFYDDITSNVDNDNIVNNNYISHIFGIWGIKYILVQGNAIRSSPYDPNYYDTFSFNDIYTNLNKSKDIVFIKKYANTSLYENLNYAPLVYATNIYNFGNISESKLAQVITNETFNITDNSVYVININGFYNDSGKINATTIANFSKPNISFVENTPTKVTVHVSNATTPYYLVFRETYDPHWAAFYPNGTEVNPNDHIAVNGFANAWYMNKTGNYTVTLYYTLQTDAWIAWGVSFAALFVTIGIGVYGWKETRKAKVRERR